MVLMQELIKRSKKNRRNSPKVDCEENGKISTHTMRWCHNGVNQYSPRKAKAICLYVSS